MTSDLRTALAAAAARLRPLGRHLRERRIWLEVGALTLLALLAAASVGRSALARATALRAEAARGERVLAEVRRWSGEIRWPTPAESLEWRRSEQALARFEASAERPLSVAHLLAQRAEEMGVGAVRVRMVAHDSVSPMPVVSAGEWSIEPAPEAVVVEFVGDWPELLAFLGALPPRLEVMELRGTGESGESGEMRTSVLLLSRRVVAAP